MRNLHFLTIFMTFLVDLPIVYLPEKRYLRFLEKPRR